MSKSLGGRGGSEYINRVGWGGDLIQRSNFHSEFAVCSAENEERVQIVL